MSAFNDLPDIVPQNSVANNFNDPFDLEEFLNTSFEDSALQDLPPINVDGSENALELFEKFLQDSDQTLNVNNEINSAQLSNAQPDQNPAQLLNSGLNQAQQYEFLENQLQDDICLDMDFAFSDDLFNFNDIPELDMGMQTTDTLTSDRNMELAYLSHGYSSVANNNNALIPSNLQEQTQEKYPIQESQNHEIVYPHQLYQPVVNPFELNAQKFADSFLDWVMNETDQPCQSCELMRRIVHSNGFQDTKLEIHMYENDCFHCILHVRFCNFGSESYQTCSTPQNTQFPTGSHEYMKHFLVQYSMLRAKEGFALRYDTVLVSTESGKGMSTITDPWFPRPFSSTALAQTDFAFERTCFGSPAFNTWSASNSIDPSKPHKSHVAAQRERTGKLQLSECAPYFHLPINEASKRLAICPTVLKKICRRNGLRRWPHRKIKSIQRIISTLEQTIAEGNGEGTESILNEIAFLKKQRAQICSGQLPNEGMATELPPQI